MRYVVFSDIHGNLVALKEMLKREKHFKTDYFIFCGDLLGYYYQAEEAAKVLKGIPNLISVRGNHDQMYLDSFDDCDMTQLLCKKYGNSYNEKSLFLKEWVEKLPLTKTWVQDGIFFTAVHGTPQDPLDGRIYPDSEIPKLEKNNVVFSGHTHYRLLYETDSKRWINPGSLGQPRDGKGFSYCVIETNPFSVNYKEVNFELSPMIKMIHRIDPQNDYLENVLYRSSR